MKLLLFNSLIVFSIELLGQIPSIQWEKTFGGNNHDYFNSFIISDDGNVVLAGTTESYGGYINSNHGNLDLWLVKIDPSGNMHWNVCFGSQSIEEGFSISKAPDAYYILGRAIVNGGDVIGAHGQSDYWIVKTDTSGNKLWSKCYGGSEYDGASGIIYTIDKGALVFGYTDSFDHDVTVSYSYGDVWIVKIDSSGAIEWETTIGGGFEDRINNNSVLQLTNGNFLIAGFGNSSDYDFTNCTQDTLSTKIWVHMLDSAGQKLWMKCYGGTLNEEIYSIVLTDDNGFYLGCGTNSNDGDISSSIGNSDIWIIKCDSMGNILWEQCYGGIYYEGMVAMCKTTDNGLALVGTCNLDNGQVSGSHGLIDIWVVKIDSSGMYEWGKAIGGTSLEEPTAIEQLPDESYIISGITNSNDGDISNHLGGDDAWVIKLSLGTNTSNISNDIMQFKVFHGDDFIYLEFFSKHSADSEIIFYDLNGREIRKENIYVNEGINSQTINLDHFTAGIYCISIVSSDNVFSDRLIVN